MYMLRLHRYFEGSIVTGLVALFCSFPLTAQAGGFALNEQSVSGLGVAFAGGAAQASDASTIFFNPAGIALLNQGEFLLGTEFVIPQANFVNDGSRYKLPNTPFNNLPISGGNGATAEFSTSCRTFTCHSLFFEARNTETCRSALV